MIKKVDLYLGFKFFITFSILLHMNWEIISFVVLDPNLSTLNFVFSC